MRVIENWNQIKTNEEVVSFAELKAGAYICRILNVEDFPEKNYLKINFDIVEGEFKDLFKNMYKNDDRIEKKWANAGTTYRSYSKNAERFFAAFITAIEKSNPNFIWDFNEAKLKDKLFVANYREEEYINDNGELKTSMKVAEIRSTTALKEGKVKLFTEIKRLPEEMLKEYGLSVDNKSEAVDFKDEDLPF